MKKVYKLSRGFGADCGIFESEEDAEAALKLIDVDLPETNATTFKIDEDWILETGDYERLATEGIMTVTFKYTREHAGPVITCHDRPINGQLFSINQWKYFVEPNVKILTLLEGYSVYIRFLGSENAEQRAKELWKTHPSHKIVSGAFVMWRDTQPDIHFDTYLKTNVGYSVFKTLT